MDLSKVPNERKLYLCRWYFRIGFACLPFIWAVNAVWFFREAFQSPEFEEQKTIRRYVLFSIIGAILWLSLLITWVSIYQLNRSSWGEFGDKISFIIPLGAP